MPSRYFGITDSGKRIHLGTRVEYARRKIVTVTSFCGVLMSAYDNGEMPPPQLADEFCRNCFRTDAWEAFSQKMEALASRDKHEITLEQFRRQLA